jgi:hypothetical protein
MEYWEFLIQKEGDRAWLPLESPTVEILEGRYRIVARSSYGNAAVEVRIAFLPEDAALGGRQRVQKRAGQTNGDGVLAIVPYTQLRPGRWQFRCSAMEEASWRYEVELQVLSVESDLWLEPIAAPGDAIESLEVRAGEAVEGAIAAPGADFTPARPEAEVLEILQGASNRAIAGDRSKEVPEVLPEPVPLGNPESISSEGISGEESPRETVADPAEGDALDALDAIKINGAGEIDAPGASLDAPELREPAGAIEPAKANLQPPATAGGAIAPETPTPVQAPVPANPPPSEPSPFTPPRDRLLQGGSDRLVRVADRLAQNHATPPAAAADAPLTEDRPPLPIALQSDRLRLTLEHSTYVTGWGRPLTLDGVLSLEGDPREATTPTLPVGLELQVSLRDPATQRMVVCLSRPLHHCALGATDANALPLPCQFALDVELPVESQGFLLLGHLGLYRATVASDEPLVEQAFTVAADATLLMRAIEPTFSPERCAQVTPVQRSSPSGRLPFQANASTLDTQLLNFVSGRQRSLDQPALPPPPTSTRSRPSASPMLPGEPRHQPPSPPQPALAPAPAIAPPPALAPPPAPSPPPQSPPPPHLCSQGRPAAPPGPRGALLGPIECPGG